MKSRARRVRERGAIYVEAIIVATAIALLFGGGVFFHKLYAGKLNSMRTSRQQAWAQALPGCSDGLPIDRVMRAVWDADDNPDSVDGLSVRGTTTPPSWMAGSARYGGGDVSVRAPDIIGGREYGVGTPNRLLCNELTRHEEDRLGVPGFLIGSLISGGGS